ncbi:hypothetical protein [Variovorax sp. EL159]|uniref:hypothetical protein n=1 Tax=Variovorax sp. EL159 TaxID=1566270 RepID=UPI0008898783|nr:hypothetical protein [Variovorax sp. EL159]SCX56436.1 hypothetical protein SAMN03159363_1698 [Variovorax sp. EL159]
MKRQVKHVLAGSAVLVLLSACGGGGGGSSGGGFPFPVPAPSTGGPSSDPTVASSPVAVVKASSSGTLGQVFTVDGSASTTASGKTRTYRWELRSRPATSGAALVDSGSAKPFFLMDVAGDYIVRLTVNDGERDSAPVDTTITSVVPVIPGPILKFAIIETTAALGVQRSGTYAACDGYRPEQYLSDFWSPGVNARTCNAVTGLPSDFNTQGRGSGSAQIAGTWVTPRAVGAYTNMAPGVLPSDTPATPVSMSYEATTNIAGLAPTPIGKTAGFSMAYSVPGYSMVYVPDVAGPPPLRPKASYRIVGSVTPQNAPPGWEAYVETLVQIDVTAYTGLNFNSRFTVYSKKFSADFSENVEFDLNAVAYSQFAGNQATYEIAVSHQVAYRRKAN